MRRDTWVAGLVILVLTIGCSGGGDTVSEPEASPPPGSPSVESPAPPPGDAAPSTAVPVKVKTKAAPTAEVVETYTQQFFDGDLDPLFAKFTPGLKEDLPRDRLQAMHESFDQAAGDEVEVLHRQSAVDGEYTVFGRWSRYENYDGVLQLQIQLTDGDRIAALMFQEVPADQVDRLTKK